MWRRLVDRLTIEPGDPPDLLIQKRLLVSVAMVVGVLALLWGALYYQAGEPLAASIPWSYSGMAVVSLSYLAITRDYRGFRSAQLAVILVLPFLLHIALGGFVGSSGVIIWSVMGPIGALLVHGRRAALGWLTGYVTLTAVATLIASSLDLTNNLSPALIRVLFLLNLGTVSVVVFGCVLYFMAQRDRLNVLLEAERDKSERLLLNVLPEEVAADLKETGTTAPRHFDAVTVLFADLVGFTAFAEKATPDELIDTLTRVFTDFDEIVERNGVEKLRTIGDSYMAAAGVPTEREDHAEVMARVALEMMDSVTRRHGIEYRIGLATGPVVAGVLGTSKFQYDIWGDTVNTASRMESSGLPGRIQVDEATYDLVKDRFRLTARGPVEVKGKGTLSTWFLEEEMEPARVGS